MILHCPVPTVDTVVHLLFLKTLPCTTLSEFYFFLPWLPLLGCCWFFFLFWLQIWVSLNILFLIFFLVHLSSTIIYLYQWLSTSLRDFGLIDLGYRYFLKVLLMILMCIHELVFLSIWLIAKPNLCSMYFNCLLGTTTDISSVPSILKMIWKPKSIDFFF